MSVCLSVCMLSSCLPVWFWGKYHPHSPGVRQSFECIHPGHSLPLSQLWPTVRIIRVAVPQVSHIWPFPTCPDASESQWPGPLTLHFTSLVLRSYSSSSQRAYQAAPYLPVLANNSRPLSARASLTPVLTGNKRQCCTAFVARSVRLCRAVQRSTPLCVKRDLRVKCGAVM